MNEQTLESKLMSLSLRFYRLLLYAYPSSFRREYGSHMTQVFRDCCQRAFRYGGHRGMLSLWANISLDLILSVFNERVFTEHEQKGIHMSKQRFIQLRSWGLIFGGIAFMLGFAADWLSSGPYNPYNFRARPIDFYLGIAGQVLIPTALVLITIGVAGLFSRYAQSGGNLVRISLGLSVSGGLLATITILPLSLSEWDLLWGVLMLGLLALFVGLMIFGITAVRGKLMRGGNWLPLIAGFYFPAFFLVSSIYEINTGGWIEVNQYIEVTGIIVTGLSLAGIGYVLLSDPPEEPVLSPA